MVMILAHGAGAPMDSPFMEAPSEALDDQGIACVRFEFPYMQKRREDGKKRPPDRQPKLLECFSEVVAAVRQEVGPGARLLIGARPRGGAWLRCLPAKSWRVSVVWCVMAIFSILRASQTVGVLITCRRWPAR